MGMNAAPRRIVSGGGGVKLQHNGGIGFKVGGSAEVSRAAEMIEGPGMRIDDPAAANGNPTFTVQEAHFVIGNIVIDGRLGVQKIGFKIGGIDAVEFTEVSFYEFSAQPTTMRGGIYTRPDNTNQVEAKLVGDDQLYSDWKGGLYTKTIPVERMWRHAVGLWWVPSVVSPIPLTFGVEIRGFTRWHPQAAGVQEAS